MGIFVSAVRNISRRKTRVLLVVVALAFSMAIMISIPSGIIANQAAAENLSENYQNIITGMEEEINKTLTLIECSLSGGFKPGFIPETESQYLNETAIYEISSIEGVKDVLPFLEKTEGTIQTNETPKGTITVLVPDYTIVGVPLNSSLIDNYVVLPTTINEGRNIVEGDRGVVLLNTENVEFFEVKVGDEVNILERYFTVIGIYETVDPLGLKKLYMDISDAQEITNLDGQVSRLDVYVENMSILNEVVSTITVLYPELYITTYEERLSQIDKTIVTYQYLLDNVESTLGQIQTVAFQEIGLAVVATSLIVFLIMLYTVRERTHEIGILKAIGFSNWNIMSQFMLEGTIMSFLAGIVGALIGSVGAPILSSLLLPSLNILSGGKIGEFTKPGTIISQSFSVTPNPQTIILAFGAIVLLGALGSLYPAWKASRTSPMEALRYE